MGSTQLEIMNKTINILLVFRTGKDFQIGDVYILAHHLKRNAGELDIQVYCLTNIVKQRIELRDVILMPLEYVWNGWWAKLNLFSPGLECLRPFLYLDLDTAVLWPISSILPAKQYQGGIILLRDFYRVRKPASGVMWLPGNNNEKVRSVWTNWITAPEIHMRKSGGDQSFIASVIKPDYYWQDITDGIVSYKTNPNRAIRQLMGNERLVCFHGNPRPRKAARGVKWVENYIKEGIENGI